MELAGLVELLGERNDLLGDEGRGLRLDLFLLCGENAHVQSTFP